MKRILSITLLLISTITLAQLPSWGMTENQFKLPNFNSKMKEIGVQAEKNNWLLKITAPKDWHNKIRTGLTDAGALDLQVNFKDSLHQSITITAAPGLKMAKVTPSTTSNATVQKQVVIDKPEIDTEVDAPEFGKIEIESNTEELLESINNIELEMPKPEMSAVKADSNNQVKPTTTVSQPVNTQAAGQNAEIQEDDASIEERKESLRKRHARSKQVDKSISYDNIRSKDDLYIEGDVVLVKRFINQGVVIYYWMTELYDPSIHMLVEKGSGKYQKDPSATQGDETEEEDEPVVEENTVTNLDFVAIDTDIDTQDELRKDYARNKRVDVNIKADQLKEDDILYVMNDTVLVERPITSTQSAYFWLVGETSIPREVERKDDNRFIIR